MRARVSPAIQVFASVVLVAFLALGGSFFVARRTAARVLWAPDLAPVRMSFEPHWWRRTPNEPSRLVVWRASACDVWGGTCCFPPHIGLSARGEVLETLPPETERVIERSRSPAGVDRVLVSLVIGRIEKRMPDPDSLRGLSDVEANLEAAFTAYFDFRHGGHAYWYHGKSREQTLRAAQAFERLGAIPAANAMRRSLEAFPAGTPTREYIEGHPSDLKDVFAPLDKIVSEVNLDAVGASYIRTKRAELSASDPGFMKAVAALGVP